MASWIFRIAAIYGLLILTPMYFLEAKVAAPAALLTHPEHYYGFIGTALAAQVMFLVIASDVRRHHPLMLVGVLEKLAFGAATGVLWAQGRLSGGAMLFGAIDLGLGALFALAWWRTRRLT